MSGEDERLVENEGSISENGPRFFEGTIAGSGRDISGEETTICNGCSSCSDVLLGTGRAEVIPHRAGTLWCKMLVETRRRLGVRLLGGKDIHPGPPPIKRERFVSQSGEPSNPTQNPDFLALFIDLPAFPLDEGIETGSILRRRAT